MHKNRIRPEPTFEYINSLFHYDPLEGKVYSKVKRGRNGNDVNVGDEVGRFLKRVKRKGDKGTIYCYINLPRNLDKTTQERRTKIIFILMTGRTPKEGFIIDHKDGNTINDKWDNLQEIQQSLNCIKAVNRKRKYDLPRNIELTKYGKFKVNIGREKKKIYLGTYNTLNEAQIVLDNFIKKYNSENYSESCCSVPSTINSNTSENTRLSDILDFYQ